VVSRTTTVRDADDARLLASVTLYRMRWLPRLIMLGTPALTRAARLNGRALSMAVKPGSAHVDPPSTVTVHDDPEHGPPFLSSVSAGGVVSRTVTVRRTALADNLDGSTQAYVPTYRPGTARFGDVGLQVNVGPAEIVPCATSAHVAPGLLYDALDASMVAEDAPMRVMIGTVVSTMRMVRYALATFPDPSVAVYVMTMPVAPVAVGVRSCDGAGRPVATTETEVWTTSVAVAPGST
jgi:hypothetical protein